LDGISDPLERSQSPLVQGTAVTMSGTLWAHGSSPSLAQPGSSANALFVVCTNAGVLCGPCQARALFSADDRRLRPIGGGIRSGQSVTDAVAGAPGVVNAVILYIEHGKATFHAVHVEGAQCVAVEARRLGVEQLVHISGISADAQSRSRPRPGRTGRQHRISRCNPGAIKGVTALPSKTISADCADKLTLLLLEDRCRRKMSTAAAARYSRRSSHFGAKPWGSPGIWIRTVRSSSSMRSSATSFSLRLGSPTCACLRVKGLAPCEEHCREICV
jgi:hypothetical protein